MIDLLTALWPYALTIGLVGAVLIAAWLVAYSHAPLYGPDEQPISVDPDEAYDETDVDITHHDYRGGGR